MYFCLKKERYILSHGFIGFSPLSPLLWPVVRQNFIRGCVAEETAYLMAARREAGMERGK